MTKVREHLTWPMVRLLRVLLSPDYRPCLRIELARQAKVGLGTVYHTLDRLHQMDWVKRDEQRFYFLTEKGRSKGWAAINRLSGANCD